MRQYFHTANSPAYCLDRRISTLLRQKHLQVERNLSDLRCFNKGKRNAGISFFHSFIFHFKFMYDTRSVFAIIAGIDL